MAIITWRESLTTSRVNGAIVGGGATTTRASCIPPANRITLPACYLYPGRTLVFTLEGVAITAATAVDSSLRFQICLGVDGTTVVFDTGLIPFVKATRNGSVFTLTIELICRSIGIDTSTTFLTSAVFQSDIVFGSPLPAAGGNGSLLLPTDGSSGSSGTDSTIASVVDVFAIPSGNGTALLVTSYSLESLN